MMRSRTRFFLCFGMALAVGVVAADSGKKAEPEKGAGDAEEVVVFTNEDLVERYGEPEPEPVKPKALAGEDEPEAVEPEPDKAEPEKPLTVGEAEAELKAARQKVVNLEKQLLNARNPYAARAELSEEEKEVRANSGEGANERYLRTKVLLERARREMQAAEKKLAEARSAKS